MLYFSWLKFRVNNLTLFIITITNTLPFMIAHKSLIVSSKSLLIKNFFYGYLFNAFKYSLQKKLLVPFIVKTHYV